MSVVPYNTEGAPKETGVYACRIPDDELGSPFLKDKFLMWFDGKWSHIGSDQNYRGAVLGWIGPLQRKMKAREA